MLCLIFLGLLTLGVIGLVCLARLPHSPLSLPQQTKHWKGFLTQLEPSLSTSWISTIWLSLDNERFSGSAYLIKGRNCNALPTQEDVHTILKDYTYLLPGSQINITIDPEFKAVWILSSISAFMKITKLIGNSNNPCPSHPTGELLNDDYHCFNMSDYSTSHPIVFNVTRAGYYSVYAYGEGYRTRLVSVKARTYNVSAILGDEKLVSSNVTIAPGRSAQFEINQFMEFNREVCILTTLQSSELFCNVTFVGNMRKDTLFFPGIVVFFSLVFVLCVVSVSVYLRGVEYYRRSR